MYYLIFQWKKLVVFLSSLSVACYRFILNYNLQNRRGFNVSRLSDLDRLSRSVEILRSYIKINVSVSVNDAEQLLQSRNVFEIEKHQLTLRFLLGFFLKTAFLNLNFAMTKVILQHSWRPVPFFQIMINVFINGKV